MHIYVPSSWTQRTLRICLGVIWNFSKGTGFPWADIRLWGKKGPLIRLRYIETISFRTQMQIIIITLSTTNPTWINLESNPRQSDFIVVTVRTWHSGRLSLCRTDPWTQPLSTCWGRDEFSVTNLWIDNQHCISEPATWPNDLSRIHGYWIATDCWWTYITVYMKDDQVYTLCCSTTLFQLQISLASFHLIIISPSLSLLLFPPGSEAPP